MNRMLQRFAGCVVCGLALVSLGCPAQTSVAPTGGSKPQPSAGGGGGDMSADDHSKGPALSDEDKALVAAQRLCPVTEEDLMADADMGGPVKIDVNGEAVFLCCKACEKKVRGNEEAILAKVAEFKKTKPSDETPKN